MADDGTDAEAVIVLANRWCEAHGAGWLVTRQLGEGGTAPVFEVNTPDGARALKVYSQRYSSGSVGETEEKRIAQQLTLKGHDCPHLVQIFDGGKFEDRLFLLMSRAPGQELAKRLADVPRNKIRTIVDQVTRAAIFLRDRGLCHRDIKAANVFVSDDFERCTLLDVSVIRDIVDPIGVGTDQQNQLPVVATARYSPPEYLFRLLEPGVELWHALTVYQLGALLHDLIVKQPLFESEYQRSAQNRYRFAWVVATVIPQLQADDVDRGLVMTAQRALDKDWRRRSALKLEDFLANDISQRKQALAVIGLNPDGGMGIPTADLATRTQKLDGVTRTMEELLLDYLRSNRVTAKHVVLAGADDASRILTFTWTVSGDPVKRVQLQITIGLRDPAANRFQLSISLHADVGNGETSNAMELPEVSDELGVAGSLARQAQAAFEQLAQAVAGVTPR
jgi:serine/threonine protein kinase